MSIILGISLLASKIVGYWVDCIAAKSETQGGVSGIQMSTIGLLDCVQSGCQCSVLSILEDILG